MKVIARVLRPTEGTVDVRGAVAPLLELGAGFDMELTGRENVFLNGAILRRSRKEMKRRLPAIFEFAELGHFIDVLLPHLLDRYGRQARVRGGDGRGSGDPPGRRGVRRRPRVPGEVHAHGGVPRPGRHLRARVALAGVGSPALQARRLAPRGPRGGGRSGGGGGRGVRRARHSRTPPVGHRVATEGGEGVRRELLQRRVVRRHLVVHQAPSSMSRCARSTWATAATAPYRARCRDPGGAAPAGPRGLEQAAPGRTRNLLAAHRAFSRVPCGYGPIGPPDSGGAIAPRGHSNCPHFAESTQIGAA